MSGQSADIDVIERFILRLAEAGYTVTETFDDSPSTNTSAMLTIRHPDDPGEVVIDVWTRP